MCVVGTTVLTVGIGDKSKELKELPIRLLVMNTGLEAVKCLRQEDVDAFVSHWKLVDIDDGQLLERVISAKPSIPTIAFVNKEDAGQEIAARSIGVTAVLDENIEVVEFKKILCQLLKINKLSLIG